LCYPVVEETAVPERQHGAEPGHRVTVAPVAILWTRGFATLGPRLGVDTYIDAACDFLRSQHGGRTD
jgi:hypothetical protein